MDERQGRAVKLSTKGRYGIKAMVDLALEYESGNTVSIATLAHSQNISEAYLERQIVSLKKAGLVESARGVFGGYRLTKSPESINVGEILRALEGKTTIVDCVDGSVMKSCDNACSCSARPLWLKLQARIDDVLNSTTLRDMAEDYDAQIKFINSKKGDTGNASLS